MSGVVKGIEAPSAMAEVAKIGEELRNLLLSTIIYEKPFLIPPDSFIFPPVSDSSIFWSYPKLELRPARSCLALLSHRLFSFAIDC